MPENPRQAALLRPASVAIQDDGNVPGNGGQRRFSWTESTRRAQTWMVWLRRGPTLTMPSLAPVRAQILAR